MVLTLVKFNLGNQPKEGIKMSGHDHQEAGHHGEDHSVNVKVGVFFVLVIISLFVIAMIN